jgi:hypothetical protein
MAEEEAAAAALQAQLSAGHEALSRATTSTTMLDEAARQMRAREAGAAQLLAARPTSGSEARGFRGRMRTEEQPTVVAAAG